MELRIKDLVKLLAVPEKSIRQWVKENRIPHHVISHQVRFNRAEINEWILEARPEMASKLLKLSIAGRPTRLTDLLRLGGIHYDLPGRTVQEILKNALENFRAPEGLSKADLLATLIDREAMMTTAVGRGIAIPHPRTPIITKVEDSRVAVFLLKKPANFGALDGRPVHTLFLLLAENPRRHLEVLSKISYLCQLPEFLDLLESRRPEDEIFGFVQAREREWRRTSKGV